MTLEELEVKMGFEAGTARRAAWQLFNKVGDPRLSTLEALAKALGVQPKDLL
jgi:transcriptional regulator with XRE-family HTH domain